MKAECTWGDGPDVLITLDGTTFMLGEAPWNPMPPRGGATNGFVKEGWLDLTARQAEALANQLLVAVKSVKELEEGLCNLEFGADGGADPDKTDYKECMFFDNFVGRCGCHAKDVIICEIEQEGGHCDEAQFTDDI